MGVASSLLQFRVCCLGLRNPWSEMQAPSRQGHVGTASSAGACALHADHATDATPSGSIIHGMHDKMLSRREWHCTCEWHFWRALAAALAKQSISSPPPRSPPGAHVSWTCRHTCHFTCACVVYIFTNPKRQVKAPPFKHLQKASVLAERAVLTTQGFCGWDRVWD